MEGRFTIILLPNENFKEIVSNIKNDLKEITKLPLVPPHVTLREEFITKDIDEFIKEYKKQIINFKVQKLEINKIDMFESGHMVFLIKKTDELQNLHEITVKISQKYVSTPKIKTFECELNEEQKELMKKYQNPFYLKYYNPHMTIVRLNKLDDKKHILNSIKKYKVPNNFNVQNICIYDKIEFKVYHIIKL